MKTHSLKTWPHEHDAVGRGIKTFEIRDSSDRDFAVGDTLLLRRWDPAAKGVGGLQTGSYVTESGAPLHDEERAHTHRVTVMHILHGGRFGLPVGLCVMAIRLERDPGHWGTEADRKMATLKAPKLDGRTGDAWREGFLAGRASMREAYYDHGEIVEVPGGG